MNLQLELEKSENRRTSNSVIAWGKNLLIVLLASAIGAAVGLYLGYHYFGDWIYELFPSYFYSIHANSFPEQLRASKVPMAAVVDVTIVAGWIGLFSGGFSAAACLGLRHRRKTRSNRL